MGPKTPSQKRKFGGIAYVDADPCYQLVSSDQSTYSPLPNPNHSFHQACDTLDNISTEGINLVSTNKKMSVEQNRMRDQLNILVNFISSLTLLSMLFMRYHRR
jgi:hypothetical protein